MIQSAFLIVMILALRKAAGKKIDVYVRYGMWLVVALRLLVPFNIGTSPFSVLSLTERITDAGEWYLEKRTEESSFLGETGIAERISLEGQTKLQEGSEGSYEGREQTEITDKKAANGISDTTAEDKEKDSNKTIRFFRKNMFRIVWIGGMILTGSTLGIQNYLFNRRLRKTGKRRKEPECLLPVYSVRCLESPCLTGIVRPAVYLNEEILENKEEKTYALIHEWTHYRHKDHLWALVRGICVTVYWFHPLVWIAAFASVKDGELACDKGTVERIGGGNRLSYGEMLLRMAQGKKKGYPYGTLMSPKGKGAELKERLFFLTEKKKSKAAMSIVMAVVMFAAAGCAFSGAGEGAEEETAKIQTEDGQQTEDGRQEEKGQQAKDGQQAETADANQEETEEEQIVELLPESAELSRDMILGADGPTLDYAKDKRIIFHDYFGLVVYNIEEGIEKSLDLKAIGCNMTQGDNTCQVRVSKDGKTVYLHPMQEEHMYRYEIDTNKLYREKLVKTFEIDLEGKELFDDYVTTEFAESTDRWQSNYIVFYGTDEKGKQSYYSYLYAEDMTLAGLRYVEDDMIVILFPETEKQQTEEEPQFPYQYDGAVEEVELIYLQPCGDAPISGAFGTRVNPETKETVTHEGIDYAAEKGTKISAAADGTVYKTGFSKEYGNYVVLLHRNGDFTYYCSCEEIYVEEGAQVERGEEIATVGNSGMSTGAHLHFALSIKGKFVDPQLYFITSSRIPE